MEKLNKILVDITPNKKLNIALAKKDMVDYIYNTSALEGNSMTYPEVETLLDGITVGGHKISDENMILNQNKSVKLLFDLIENKKFDFTKFTTCLLHNEVSQNEALKWGEFRDANVRIGGTEFIPPKFENLDKIFEENFQFINQIKEPVIQAFCSFLLNARSQYFYDGNKRTSRLIMNGILLNSGYPMLNIKAKNKLEFNKMMIKYYDNDDIEKSVLWLYKYYKKQISKLD
ncbi:MAG: Fic family protein [Campylobacterota bacterium]|nr:Fic family protein [Campylobacterota bacterium]